MREDLAAAEALSAPEQPSPAEMADDDPRAPWMLDPLYGGMSPLSRRKSWEGSQRRKAEFSVIDGGQGDDALHGNDVPLPSGIEDYGLAAEPTEAPAPAKTTITARPYEFCDPAKIPRRDRLYGTHLFRGFTSATVAPGALGKSALLTNENLAHVTHRPLLKIRVASRPLRAWYWNLEDPFEEIQRKIQAACLHHGVTADELGDRLHVNGREDALVIARQTPSGAMVLEPVVDALIAEIRARQIDVLTIDPFVSSHAVSENDNSAIDAVVKTWNRVAGGGNCAVELAHHARKLGDNEVTAESARGAVAMVAACRDVRVLNRMTKEEGERAGIENHRLYFRCYSDKANLAPPSDVSDWYRLVSVDLCNGPPGDSDHIPAVARWNWPDALDGLSARDLFTVQKHIAEGEWRESAAAEKWAGHAVAEVLDLDVTLTPVQARLKSLLKTWIETGALKTVRRQDEHRKERTFIVVGEWATP